MLAHVVPRTVRPPRTLQHNTPPCIDITRVSCTHTRITSSTRRNIMLVNMSSYDVRARAHNAMIYRRCRITYAISPCAAAETISRVPPESSAVVRRRRRHVKTAIFDRVWANAFVRKNPVDLKCSVPPRPFAERYRRVQIFLFFI